MGFITFCLSKIYFYFSPVALQEHRISRQFSTDSMSSVNSCSSACSGNSGKSGDALSDKKKKKKGWVIM